jgi:hypothetical protein
MLIDAGVNPDGPIPKNMAEILQNAREQMSQVQEDAFQEATVNLPLPVSPQQPPLEIKEPVPIEQLPLEQQQHYKNVIQEMMSNALEAERMSAQRAAEQRSLGKLSPGVRTAAQAAAASAGPVHRKMNLQQTARLEAPEVVDDLAAYEKVAPNLPPLPKAKTEQATAPKQKQKQTAAENRPPVKEPPVKEEAEQAEATSASDMGTDKVMSECPHCRWPLDVPDIPEPDYADKLSFLHAILGEKSYEKSILLLGKQLEVVFRSLTTKEMDAIYRQASMERTSGALASPLDFFERINRLRMYLQLKSLRSVGFHHDLPEGLSNETNSLATSFWADTEVAAITELGPEATGLTQVEHYMLTSVLPTEMLNHIVFNACNQFNRTVAKLEAMVDNADFWQETESQA